MRSGSLYLTPICGYKDKDLEFGNCTRLGKWQESDFHLLLLI